MNTRYIKLLGLFLCSYLAVLIYPISYLFSPLLTVQQHQLVLGGITLLTLPLYIVGFKHFGTSIIRQTVKYAFFNGNVLRRVFAGAIIFLLIGLGNAVIITGVTSIQAIPFTYWNPVIEGGILILCLFALLLQMAIIQSYQEKLPSEEDITEAFDRAEEVLQDEDLELPEQNK